MGKRMFKSKISIGKILSQAMMAGKIPRLGYPIESVRQENGKIVIELQEDNFFYPMLLKDFRSHLRQVLKYLASFFPECDEIWLDNTEFNFNRGDDQLIIQAPEKAMPFLVPYFLVLKKID